MAFFEASVELDCSQDEIFKFLTSTSNIEEISPPEIGLQFVNTAEVLKLGERLEFQVVHFGQIQKIIHEITRFEPSELFVESLVEGPLPKWEYTHRFEKNGMGVVVIDEIEFEPPGGLIGLLISEQKLLDNLEDGFDHRYRCLEKHFSSDD